MPTMRASARPRGSTEAVAGHSERARTALAHLSQRDPALGHLALWCLHRDGDGKTRTEGDAIVYGPDFSALPLAEQVGLAGHHVLHVALRHGARQGALAVRLGEGFDATLFNLACDALVNETLLRAGHALPRPAVRACELAAEALRPPPEAESLLAEWDAERLYMALRNPDGSGSARDRARDYGTVRGFRRDLRSGGAGEDRAASEEEWRGRLTRALETGRAAGLGIGRAAGPFADLPGGRIPWERLLRRLLARALTGRPRLSHRRPANRWIAAEDDARRLGRPVPVFEPGLLRDHMRPRIAVALDTSSSIPDASLSLFAAEAVSIARRFDAEIRLLAFDTDVHADITVAHGDLLGALRRQPVRRGGGTSFVDVVARAASPAPSALVVLTDLEGAFGADPQLPVIWVSTGEPARPPPYGRLILA